MQHFWRYIIQEYNYPYQFISAATVIYSTVYECTYKKLDDQSLAANHCSDLVLSSKLDRYMFILFNISKAM